VYLDEHGFPVRIQWEGQLHPIDRIAYSWRVDDEWWKKRVFRDHYKVTTTTGYLLIITHDLASDTWAITRLYD
jgi:hypothetical protein